jgi:drug/metabolite transporter (DMT)-like permease
MAMFPRPAAFSRRVSAHPDAPITGIALIIAAAILIPISDGFAKILAGDLPAVQIVWLRYGLQTLLIVPFALWWHGSRIFFPANPWTQAVRSLLITCAAFCFFSAVRTIPLADAVAVFFINPFIVTALSPLLLGERIGVWRWSAVVAGFLGTMILVRPGFEVIDVGHLYAMGAGTAFALFVLVTRRLAGGDPPLVTTFLTGIGAFLLTSIAMPFVWTEMTMAHVWPTVGMGVLGCFFSMFVILAYERASASQLAPFGYVEIAAAAAVGWLVFGDFPDALSWVGIAVIAASGIIIAWREARLARGARRAMGPRAERQVP